MELSDKYNRTLGYYAPSLFYIHLSGIGRLKDIAKWDEERQSTFLHEYIHFLQVITTVQGLTNMYRIGEYLRYVTTVAKDPIKNEIHVPVNPLKTTGYNLKNNWLLSKWTFGEKIDVNSLLGYAKLQKGTIVDDLTKEQIDVNGIALNCLDKNGYIVNVEFGTLQMMEGMAKEVEELAYPTMKGRSPYNPYYIGRDVADSIIKGVGKKGNTLIALYDFALQSSIPGYSFVCYLENKAKQGYTDETLTPEVIYDELFSLQVNHAQVGQTHFANAYNKAISLAAGVMHDFTGGQWVYAHIDYWYKVMLKRGSIIRFQYPNLFIDIANHGGVIDNTLFNNILQYLGTPLISNDDGKYEYKRPRKMWMMSRSDMVDIYAMIQTHFVFEQAGKYQCDLIKYCTNKRYGLLTHKVDARCFSEPWKRMRCFNRCPFCQWWYYKGFGKTKLINP